MENKEIKTHLLKIWQDYLKDVKSGKKNFEVRLNDRDYQVGDCLELQGWDNNKKEYTGDQTIVQITYILTGGQFGIEKGYVVMGIKLVSCYLCDDEVEN